MSRSASPNSHSSRSLSRFSPPSTDFRHPLDPSLPHPSTFADGLAKNSSLTPVQSRELQALIKLCSGHIAHGDLLWRLSTHATQLRIENLLQQILQKEDTSTEVLQDVKKIFKGSACMTPEDKTTVLGIVKDTLAGPTVASYNAVDSKVKRRLMEKKDDLGLAHLFEQPARQQVLDAYLKECCRSVRNQLRRMFVRAVKDNKTHCMVAKDMAKFRLEDRYNLPANFLARVLIILSWARANITIDDDLAADDDEPEDDDDDDDDSGSSQPPSRKRRRSSKKAQGGRTAKQDSFWHRFDTHLRGLISQHGTNVASPAWTAYIKKLVSEEQTATQRATVQTPAFTNTFEHLTGTFDLSLFTPQSPPPPPEISQPSRAPSTSSNRGRSKTPEGSRSHDLQPRSTTITSIPRASTRLDASQQLPPTTLSPSFLPVGYGTHHQPAPLPDDRPASSAPSRPPTAVGQPSFGPHLPPAAASARHTTVFPFAPQPSRHPHFRPGSSLNPALWPSGSPAPLSSQSAQGLRSPYLGGSPFPGQMSSHY